MRNAYILVVKSEGNRPLGRPRCRWVATVIGDSQGSTHNAYDPVADLQSDIYCVINVLLRFRECVIQTKCDLAHGLVCWTRP
jgi:hypothetical protein